LTDIDIRWVENSDIPLKNGRLSPPSVLLSFSRFGFAEGLSIPVLLGNLKREHIAWASSAHALTIVELPGRIIFSSETSWSDGITRGGPDAHEETVAACNAVLKGNAKGSEAKDREKIIRENTGHTEPTGNINISILVPGRSIGQQAMLVKGTFGIYVTNDGTLLISFVTSHFITHTLIGNCKLE
jgi:hypothetical protein